MRHILLYILMLLLPATILAASDTHFQGDAAESCTIDSIFAVTAEQSKRHWHYESHFYFRGFLKKTKHNLAFLLLSNRSFYRHGGRTLLTESMGVQYHDEPSDFARKVYYTYGSTPDTDMMHDYLMDCFNLTLYEDFLLGDHLLSPLSLRNRHYYRYKVTGRDGDEVTVRFWARHRNCQLVSGSVTYNQRERYVTAIRFGGGYGFMKFNISAAMGTRGQLRYLPQRIDIDFSYRYMLNKFIGRAMFIQSYDVILPRDRITQNQENKQDVSRFMVLQRDTTPMRIDSAMIASHRPVSLTRDERAIYEAEWGRHHPAPVDTSAASHQASRHRTPRWLKMVGEMGEEVFHSHNFSTSQYSQFRLRSPEVNYSDWRGVSLRQRGQFQMNMDGGHKVLEISPDIAYNFRPKLPVMRLKADYLYSEKREARITAEVAQSAIFGSAVQLSALPAESVADREDESFLFRDMELSIGHSMELINGLSVSVGIRYNKRMPHRMADSIRTSWDIRSHYTSLAPRLYLSYTPGLRYYMTSQNGKEKLGSRWPTFCIDYEVGVRSKLFSSISNYERIELMMDNEQRLSPIHKLLWKVGGGWFTRKKNVDFVSYAHFNNGITHYSWNDEHSGVFQLLSGENYNDSYHYLRGHVTLESPMLMLGRFNTYYLRSERLYLNALYTDQLFPYIEVGYGVSTHLVDVSFFTAHLRSPFTKVGVKFNLHIFD